MTEPQPLSLLQLRQLLAGLREDRVKTRGQGHAKLSYLAAWDVRRTLIRVFGFGGYSATLLEAPQIVRLTQDSPSYVFNRDKNAPKVQNKNPDGSLKFNWVATAMATVALYIPQLQATYTEAAVASQTGPDIGEVTDFAVKTAESDAFKRAAMNLGTQFGLSLYDNGSTSDVVGTVLEDYQAGLLKDFYETQAAKRGQQAPQQDIPDPTPQRQETRVAPAEVSVSGGYVDQEGDWHDPEVDPAAMEQAKDSVRGAFGG